MNQHDALEKEILAILSEGVVIDKSIQEFIRTSTGNSLDEIFLNDAAFSESSEFEAALDLIFFPDHKMRLRIEADIPEGFNESDEERLICAVNAATPVCHVRIPFSDHSFMIKVPERIVARFIKRFNLTRKIPGGLRVLVSQHFPGMESLVFAEIRAKAGKGNVFSLITDFLENLSSIFPPMIEDLEIIMTISGMFPEEAEISPALTLAHRKWEFALKKHEDIERALASGCIEELMAKGMRIQAINRDDIERKMAAADRLMSLLRFNF